MRDPWGEDCSDYHGSDCECSKCKEKAIWSAKPREHYEEKYALPKTWYYKNMIKKIIRGVFVIIGGTISISSIWFGISDLGFWGFLGGFAGGLVFIFGSIIGMADVIKYNFQCDDSIRIEKPLYDYEDKRTWDDLYKEKKIPENYIILKEIKNNWRYK